MLIKEDESRCFLEVLGNQIKVFGMCSKGNRKNVNIFKNLVNKMYDVNLKFEINYQKLV